MTQFTLRLFGHPQIEMDGRLVEMDTRKAIALLAYLALTGQSHSRDALAAFLWPDYDHSNARAALRRTLSTLSKATGPETIESDWEKIGLKLPADFWMDISEYKSRLAEAARHEHPAEEICEDCVSELQLAVELYRGDFMDGFSLRDSAPFDEWQFFQREELARSLASALERLSLRLGQNGQYGAAIDAARRWVALDTLREEAHRQLMLLYALSGQHGAALRQYRECARILKEELGVVPVEETTRLYQEIVEHRIPASPKPEAPAPRETFSGEWNLPVIVGRAREWSILNEALDRREERFIALVGEAGIGKTFLAEAFVAQAREKGAVVLVGHCYAGEHELAYSPLLEAIRPRLALTEIRAALLDLPTPWLYETAWLLPELAALVPHAQAQHPAEGLAAQSRFFEGLRQVLLAVRGANPSGVLLIDDLHLADSATLDFMNYLVRRLRGQGLLVLVTWVEDGSPSVTQLRRMLAEAERGGVGTRIRPKRLSPAEVNELVAAHGNLPPGLSDRLQKEVEGLPFFVIEYLSAIKDGRISETDGHWGLPHGVRDLLHTRLAVVTEVERQLLATAAVIGRSFDFDALLKAGQRSEEETVAALEQLVARGLIREQRPARSLNDVLEGGLLSVVSGGGPQGAASGNGHTSSTNNSIAPAIPGGVGPAATVRYSFSHEKMRALVYEETSQARRRLLHRRVAEALASQVSDLQSAGMQASIIAHHFHLAGQNARAAEYFNIAGQHARRLHANTEALLHFQLALACGHPDTAELNEAIGDLQTLQGRYSEALKSYEAAAVSLCSECPPRLEHKLGKVHMRRGDWEQTEAHFSKSLETLGEAGDAGLRSRIYADWSQAAAQHGKIDRATEFASQSQQLAATTEDWLAQAQSENIMGILKRSAGQLEEARQHLLTSLAAARRIQNSGAQVAALNNLALVYSGLDDVKEAIRLTQAALELCIESGDRHQEAALRDHLADFYHAVGQSDLAMDQLEKAVTIFSEVGVENGKSRPEIWKLSEW